MRKGGFGLGELPKILGFHHNISATTGAIVTSNLARNWRLPRPIIKSHTEERVGEALG